MRFIEDSWSIEEEEKDEGLKSLSQVKVRDFREAVTPRTIEILRRFSIIAPSKIPFIFCPQAFFELSRRAMVVGGRSNVGFNRIMDMPEMMELKFERGFSWIESRFPWLDRNWYLMNYDGLNSENSGEEIRDGGVRIFLDAKRYYHYCHVLTRKQQGDSLNIYRGTINKQDLATAIIDDYIDFVNEMYAQGEPVPLNAETFIETLFEKLNDYLEDGK